MVEKGIKKALGLLVNLSSLDVRTNFHVDNTLLEAALNSRQQITIYCNDTSINTIEFEYKYPETTRKSLDVNYYSFKYKNLIFESAMTMRVPDIVNQKKIWQQDGFYYIGSPMGSEDEDYDEFDYKNCYNDDEYEDNDDDDDFFNDDEEQEMYKEMD